MASGFYAKGTSEEFLQQKGFDDKWTVKEDKKKTQGWETVLRGPKKKNNLSVAEKKAKAAKISEEVLKGAPAVRADVDGARLSKLLAKDTKREDGEREKKEKKEKKEAPKNSAPQKPQQPAKPQKTKSVPLPARELKGKLEVISAQYDGAEEVQLLHVAQVFEEAFLAQELDYDWAKDTELGADPRNWAEYPAAMLPQDTRDAAVEWLGSMPQDELANFFDFLVGSALPGGGLNGKGGDKPYVGLKALLQLMLQCVAGEGKGSWHDQGLRPGKSVLRAEGRVATAAAAAMEWMLVQLARQSPLAALNGWFSDMLPVAQLDRAKGGKVALQSVKALEHILNQAELQPKLQGPTPVSTERLISILHLLYPEAAEEGSKEGGEKGEKAGEKGKGGKEGGNKEAMALLGSLLPSVVRVSPIGLQGATCAKGCLEPLLAVAAAPASSQALQDKAIELVLLVLKRDEKGFESWLGCFGGNLRASLQLLQALNTNIQGFPASLLQSGMQRLEKEINGMLAATNTANENLSEAAAAARRAKTKKKQEKTELLYELLEQAQLLRSKFASRRRNRCLCALFSLFSLLLVAAVTTALLQPACWKQVEPIAKLASEGQLAGEDKVLHAAKGCAEVFQQRTQPLLEQGMQQAQALAEQVAQQGRALVAQYT